MNIRRALRRTWWHITGQRDVIALKRALGYSTQDDARSTMRDGTLPVCGMCEARKKYPELHVPEIVSARLDWTLAENAKFQEEIEGWNRRWETATKAYQDTYLEETKELRAENERLRLEVKALRDATGEGER